jgi:hypothetical protein
MTGSINHRTNNMKRTIKRIGRICRGTAIVAMLSAGMQRGNADDANPGHVRTQVIGLQAGWNAVFLEVTPLDAGPGVVFGGLPVDRVATLFENPVSNQFVTDPGVDLFKGRGWGVWYAPGLPEAFLKSLDAINGNQAYLIHAKSACQWRVSGQVQAAPAKWQPNAFNLVGFPVRAAGGPTFAEFFAGSKAHHGQAIYRLVEGRWKQVLQPSAESLRSGEAFWIFCKGASDYQGPLRVETASRQGLLLGRGAAEMILRNDCPHPLTATVRQVPGDSSPLPLSILVRVYGNVAAPVAAVAARMPAGAWEQPLPTMEAAGAVAIPFECRGAEMTRARQGSLLQITTDLGTETWIPAAGIRDDLGE